jgi:hypothetical protein
VHSPDDVQAAMQLCERRDFAIMLTSHSHSDRVAITPKEVE